MEPSLNRWIICGILSDSMCWHYWDSAVFNKLSELFHSWRERKNNKVVKVKLETLLDELMINNANHLVHANNSNRVWIFTEQGQWTAAVRLDMTVITAQCQGLRSPGLFITTAPNMFLFVWLYFLCVFQSPTLWAPWSGGPIFTSSSARWPWSFIISRRFWSFCLSLCLDLTVYCKLAGFLPGDGVPCSSGVQGWPGGLSARLGEAVDHVPEGTAQLLSARRLTLLLQPLARHERHHPHAGTGRHPRPLLHATQQARWYTAHRLKGEGAGLSLRLSSSSLPASPGRRCVCLICSSSLESLRAGLKSRNPQSLFGPLCQMKRCLNPGIVMQSICEFCSAVFTSISHI